MSQKLVIVESPAKARTLQKYLGKEFRVLASMGHVRDLPKSGLAIDLEHDFEPEYEITKQKVVTELRQALKGADVIYLATDPDREGEAIAWHITQALKVKRTMPVHRVVFHEITKNAVQSAIGKPRQIDTNLVDAQQARRVLDRLVGYQLSPLLWDKVRRGLSAGRVQSVAVRLIVEREREIEAFKPVEYWTIEADLRKHQSQVPSDTFRAILIECDGTKLDKFAIEHQGQAQEIVANLKHAQYVVQKVTSKDTRRNPAPPFTTSTLQQEAGRKLGFSAKKTMMLAQRLYEGVELGGEDGSVGLITYMRTDSVNVAKEAQNEARDVIMQRYGKAYLPEQSPTYKTRAKGAQEAHEAIRPTSSIRGPETLTAILEYDMFRLYDLIWKRFVASQMAPAIFDRTTIDIAAIPQTAGGTAYTFRATGSVLKFSGFLEVYREGMDEGEEDEDKEKRLPRLAKGDVLDLLALLPIQHFTEPAPRFTEASLVKDMEQLGIGRPSTYAPIISTIQERQYVELREKKLFPTALGRIVTDLLVQHFSNIIDYDFTSDLEQQLDDVAAGEKKWVPLVREFYGPFAQTLEHARQEMRNVKREEIPTKLDCPRCKQGTLVIKFGRNGEFLACSRYHKKNGKKVAESSESNNGDSCDFTSDFHYNEEGSIILDPQSAPELSTVLCTECGRPMVKKKGRFGEFLGCSGYPECKTIRRMDKQGNPAPLPEPTGVTCPKCQRGEMLKRRGRFGRPFYGCSRYPDCDYTTNDLALVNEYVAEPEQPASQSADSSVSDTASATTRSRKRTTPAAASDTSKKTSRTTRKSSETPEKKTTRTTKTSTTRTTRTTKTGTTGKKTTKTSSTSGRTRKTTGTG